MSLAVRVRFAPSPTGYLHVGGARTALFNWLYARHTGGRFILRVEDTDRARNTDQAIAVILKGLRWLGLEWDEGPEAGGACGPYFQSQRCEIYERYFQRLKDGGWLFEDQGAWRFRSPRERVLVEDEICGPIEFDLSNPDTHPDMTIRRPDGSWIFHFVNVVDDIEMKISHVIRGEDHLSNTPKHLELFKVLGAAPPRYAHIPLILNKDGSKMSKRDQGASVSSYLEGGYAPEAVVNYLCLLGWSPKDDREKLEIREVVERFELGKINRKSAHFDFEKCNWLNAQYLQAMPMSRYRELAEPWLPEAARSDPNLEGILALEKMKVTHLTEIPHRISFFFTEEFSYDAEAVEKTLRKQGALDRLRQLAAHYTAVSPWEAANLEAELKALAAAKSCKPAEFIHPARVAASGRSIGPSLYHMLEVLGKERVLARFGRAISMASGE